MLLGTLVAQLRDAPGAALALETLADAALRADVAAMGARFGVAPAAYAAGAVERFSNLASDADWLAIIAALGRAEDPGRVAMAAMLRWSLRRDAAEVDGEHV